MNLSGSPDWRARGFAAGVAAHGALGRPAHFANPVVGPMPARHGTKRSADKPDRTAVGALAGLKSLHVLNRTWRRGISAKLLPDRRAAPELTFVLSTANGRIMFQMALQRAGMFESSHAKF
jgi:hypothetical protein